ncbi:MAG: hypothetical protein ACRDQA_08675 [Nocardioidaceae bacterium]
MSDHNVRFWDVRRNRTSKKPSYEVRWVVAGRQKSRTRSTKALAENLLSDLRQAARRGEAFDPDTGLPESMRVTDRPSSWYDFACVLVDMKWPHAAAKSRDSMTDALATVTPALVVDRPGAPEPDALRVALRQYGLPPPARSLHRPGEIAGALRWLQRASLPLPELASVRYARAGLEALSLRMDGKAAAATTIRRKRAIFYNALQYAVELEELPANPLTRVSWSPPKVAEVVDRRVVVNPRQSRELLTAVTYVGQRGRGRHLMAMFACMYYGALRRASTW